jgi:hypothetical protein
MAPWELFSFFLFYCSFGLFSYPFQAPSQQDARINTYLRRVGEMNIYKKVCGSEADEKFMNLLLLVSTRAGEKDSGENEQSTFHTDFR